MNTCTLEQATATCRDCGQVFRYEPIYVGLLDLARNLHARCEQCADVLEREAQRRYNDDRQAAIEESIRAQIPPDLLATDVRHPDFNAELWSAVSRWRPGAEFWLGIVGASGACKTRCMSLLAAKALRGGVRVLWTTANRLKDASADRGHRERAVSLLAREHLADCLHASWLFLDDLGKNEWSPAFESQLFQILDHRKNHRLPLVFSSNAHPEEFSHVISALNAAPIIGRLLDRTTLLDLCEP